MLKLFLFFIVMSIPATLTAADITNMRIGYHKDITRLVFDMNGNMNFQAKMADNPYRLFVITHHKEMMLPDNFELKAPFQSFKKVKIDKDLMRIELIMNAPFIIQSAFMIEGGEGSQNRMVIDLKSATEDIFLNHKDTIHGPLNFEPIVNDNALQASQKPPIIMIDAGHGGRDSGAVASNGIFEKDITLSIATLLANTLNHTGRYDARLTRDNDSFITLYDRVKKAREINANLFLSIHADSLRDSQITQGASVYTLSETASDAQSEKLAIRENLADKIGGIEIKADESTMALLIDLSMRDTIMGSNDLAKFIVKEFEKQNIVTLADTHRQAPFAVLRAPDIPSVLIETGFISNANEAEKLTSVDHQIMITNAVKNALDNYFATR